MNKRIIIILIVLLIITISASLRAGFLDNDLRVITSDENGIVLEVEVPWPDITEVQEGGALYHKITIPGFGNITDVGKPQLPLRGVLIGAPDASEPSIEVLSSDYSILEGYDVYPVPKPVVVEDNGDRLINFEFTKDAGVYGADSFLPSQIAEIGFTGFMRDQKVVQLKVFPFQFNPATNQLRFYTTIRIKVNFGVPQSQFLGKSVGSSVRSGGQKRLVPGKDDPYERLLKGTILNYNEIRGEGE